MSAGTYNAKRTSQGGEVNVPLTLDFWQRNEIVGGATIVSATVKVLLNDVPNNDLTVSVGTVVNGAKGTHSAVQWLFTDVSGKVGSTYTMLVTPTLSTGGEMLPETVAVLVVQA